MGNKTRILNFSEEFLKIEFVESAELYAINQKTIVINIGSKGIEISGKILEPYKSAVYSNIELKKVESLLLITMKTELFTDDSFAFSEEIKKKWKIVYEVFPLPHLKDTKLWRSNKDKIGNIELNFWFAQKKTGCGVHNKHDFKEVHTQVFGIGRMQKFYNNDALTLYQDVYMSPGNTHEPFYDKDGIYPWHRYYTDTECIWLAIEIYDK